MADLTVTDCNCGGKARLCNDNYSSESTIYFVLCYECRTEGPFRYDSNDAVIDWNLRQEPPHGGSKQ